METIDANIFRIYGFLPYSGAGKTLITEIILFASGMILVWRE